MHGTGVKDIFTFMWPCIVTDFFLIKPTYAIISQIYFCQETLHVSGSSSAHHQEFSHCTFGTGICHAGLMTAFKHNLHDIYQCRMYSGKTPDDGQRNCPKHAEFLDKNKFGKWLRMLVLLKIN